MSFFEIIKRDLNTRARLGLVNTTHGQVKTPAFLPIGTKGSVKAIMPEELKFWGAEIILANTYHLWLRPGDALVNKAGGLHKFISWDGPIVTDSGGFQVFSLARPLTPERSDGGLGEKSSPPGPLSPGERGSRRLGEGKVKVSEAGVEFRDDIDGSLHLLTPEASVQIQSNLGSDVALVLDDVPGLPASEERIRKSLGLTLRWAERAKKHHQKILKGSINPSQKLFGIVQGGDYEHLRKESVKKLQEIGFDGYGIGGLAVGEAPEIMYKVLGFTIPHLEEDKPRHLLGVGYPEQIVKAVSLGVDMFDCVLPTRNARHGDLFVNVKAGFRPLPFPSPGLGREVRRRRTGEVETSLGYEIIKITNEQYKEDFTPVDNICPCYLCLHHNRAYLRHLFAVGEPLAIRLATMHNLRFYLELAAKIRRAIEFESFEDFAGEYLRAI